MQKIELIKHYKTRQCLVIDDYPDIRASIKRMIQKFGAENVDTASSGEEAIEKCSKKHYDVILADYNLGERKSGQQILEELRYRGWVKYSSIYVMITAETTRDKVYGAIENQPDAYLAKPFTPPALQQRLDALLIAKQELKPINDAADKGNFAQAIKFCQHKIAENDRYRIPCLKMLGQFYFITKQYQAAVDLYLEVLAERSLTWAQIGLGRAYLAMDQLDQSEQVFQRLVDESCPFLEVYDGLAEVHARRGDLHEAQSVLERAIELAPDAILRQKKLADYAAKNDDLERAERSYRRVVKVGYHSVYEKPENYFDFVHCLNKSAQNQSGSDKKRYEEANEIIARAGRRYKSDPDVVVQAKFAQAEVAAANGKEGMAKEYMRDAEENLVKLQASHEFSPVVSLEFARALDATGEKDRAKQVLRDLAKQHADNPEVQTAIDGCLDEPVSAEGKQTIVRFNKEGKVLFENKDYLGAVDFFDKALRIYPNHVALNLNLAMALLRAMQDKGKNPTFIKRVKRVMQKLKNLDSSSDYYALYSNLKQQVEKL